MYYRSDFYKPQIMTFTRNIKIVNSDPQIRFRLVRWGGKPPHVAPCSTP